MAKSKQKKALEQKVRVALGSRSYDVHIGHNITPELGRMLGARDSKRAVIIADQRLKTHRQVLLAALQKAGWQTHEIAVEAGERLKDLDRVFPIYGQMLKAKIDRSSTLFALGGGTIGDAAGFIASTYLRGIPWVGLPTTLLAQTDSSIGGKTGVNHPEGKNLIGTFHQPSLVVCDTSYLTTLKKREVVSGLGEVLKYGLIYDREFFSYCQDHWEEASQLEPDVITKMVKTSVAFKAKVVAKDEFDRKGLREALNFGHTFGHALEALTQYQGFQHGEAVIWGMRFALALSAVRGALKEKAWLKADQFLQAVPVPALPVQFKPADYFELMKKDKKAKEGQVRFVLLKSIGRVVLDRNITSEDLHAAFERLR